MHPFISGILESLSVGSHWNNDQILREEIFSLERLEQHAQTLAAAQAVSKRPGFRRSLRARYQLVDVTTGAVIGPWRWSMPPARSPDRPG